MTKFGSYMKTELLTWRCYQRTSIANNHDDVIKWKHFPRYWPFVRGIHRWPVNSPHKGQWRGALTFSLNKRLSKQWWGWWFETPSLPWWRQFNAEFCITFYRPRMDSGFICWWQTYMERNFDVAKWKLFPRYWLFVRGIHRWLALTKASDAELWCFLGTVHRTNDRVNNRDAGDLRRHSACYDVIVIWDWGIK